ncbi:MAG: imidazoleglycerol-phosphate dehydratase HisB [Defluviitaleaceae bacterium]|nr:imidazoleglycerol-phosphate dehydratase HisB [Defluviitaleaceae bacterium]
MRRKTNETEVTVAFGNQTKIDTGVGFYNHMLELFAFRSGLKLEISASGDMEVDAHHTIEDVGITLGRAVSEMLGDKNGLARYGSARVPMDECLAQVDVDISGRPYLVFNADVKDDMMEEFFRAVAFNAGITLHVNLLYGKNEHHKCEAIFKAFGSALGQAIKKSGEGVPSTKGVL